MFSEQYANTDVKKMMLKVNVKYSYPFVGKGCEMRPSCMIKANCKESILKISFLRQDENTTKVIETGHHLYTWSSSILGSTKFGGTFWALRKAAYI